MGRNSSGNYSAPAGNPVVSGTPIATSWANGTITDIGSELTNSLDRNGRGGMLAALRGVDGTVSAPAVSFTAETSSGLYRIGTNDLGIAINAAKIGEWNTSGLIVQGTTVSTLFSGPINSPSLSTFTGSATRAPLNLVPLAAPSTPSNGDIWIETTSNAFKAQINGATKSMLFDPIGAKSQLPAVGQQVSSTSGTGSYSGAKTDATVTGTATITTTGRPVLLILQPDGTNPAWTGMQGNQTGNLNLSRGGVDIATWQFNIQAGVTYGIPISPIFLDVVGAGTYAYKMTITQLSGISNVNSYVLVAYEL